MLSDIFLIYEKKKKELGGTSAYGEELLDVLLLQVGARHHPPVKVHLRLEAHLAEAQVGGLHVVDGPTRKEKKKERL